MRNNSAQSRRKIELQRQSGFQMGERGEPAGRPDDNENRRSSRRHNVVPFGRGGQTENPGQNCQ